MDIMSYVLIAIIVLVAIFVKMALVIIPQSVYLARLVFQFQSISAKIPQDIVLTKSRQPQDKPVYCPGTHAIYDHRTRDHEHFGRSTGNFALGLVFQRRGHHGICKACDRH